MAQPCRTARCLFLVENLDLEAASLTEGARWEQFQIAHLNDDSTFRIEDKSRQIAWSWLCAAEAIAEAVLDGQSSIFVSINQDEAKEKIRYARQILEALRPDRRIGLKRDNELGLELANGARLLSLPARPPRGRSRTNIYLDEYAHVAKDVEIYTAALPIISKGGRLRVGSSPMGASGRFWEVFSEKLRPYPGYRRKQTPWWEVHSFCRNVAEARKLAPTLLTAQRIELFGSDRIKALYANMPEEDFRQEYECAFVDESVAWITWDEIKAVQDSDLTCVLAAGVDDVLVGIRLLVELVRQGEIEAALVAGVDIGRTRDLTELCITGMTTAQGYPLRAVFSLAGVPFDDQLAVLTETMHRLPVVTMLIDQTGIGRNLAENMETRFPGKVHGMDFTNQSKVVWATDAKTLIQQRRTPLPVNRDLAYQIHSIKRTVTANKYLVFDTAANEKYHADKFWAWALALAALRFYSVDVGTGIVQRPDPLTEIDRGGF